MARANYYKSWCPTHNKWVYQWNTKEPTVCSENAEHLLAPNTTRILEHIDDDERRQYLVKGTQDTLLYSKLDTESRAVMFQAFPGAKFEIEYCMLTFHESIIDNNSYAFELIRSMNLMDPTNPEATDKQDVIVSQVYYSNLRDMFAIANKIEYFGGIYRLFFTWGTTNEVASRLPFFVESKWGDRIVVYPTRDTEHRMPTIDNPNYGIGSDPLDYFEWYMGIPGSFRIFHPYTRFTAEEYLTNKATWPDDTPDLKKVFGFSIRGTRFAQD